MRHTRLAAGMFVAAALIATVPAAVAQGDWHVDLVFGNKALESEDWAPVEDQPEFGVEGGYAPDGWPVAVVGGILRSRDTNTSLSVLEFEGITTEVSGGVRKTWGQDRIRPYVAGGLVLINAEVAIETLGVRISNDDQAPGAWLSGGIAWRLGRTFRLGLALRFSAADVTIAGVDADAGGTHFGLTVGWGSPAR